MKIYSTLSPSLDGVISNDYLYYENTHRPIELPLVKEGNIASEKDISVLEKYFNDIYNLFLRKLSVFAGEDESDEEILKLQALLQELIKVKKLIKNSSKAI